VASGPGGVAMQACSGQGASSLAVHWTHASALQAVPICDCVIERPGCFSRDRLGHLAGERWTGRRWTRSRSARDAEPAYGVSQRPVGWALGRPAPGRV